MPQTMSGVHFLPEAGLSWDSVHSINVGFDALHEFGSKKNIGFFYPTAYYEYNQKPFRFYMGSFPRKYALDNYPRIFFQDSISYYRPNINGFYSEIRGKGNYLNFWLDWTSRQSPTDRETFFIGISGKYQPNIFYLQNFSYIYHYAGTMNLLLNHAIFDNALLLTSLGLDLSGRTIFQKLEINGGWAAGFNRDRTSPVGWIAENGFLMETKIEYRFIGIFNSFYAGDGQMYYYPVHGNDLYWGDPIYRARSYDRLDTYLIFINNKVVSIRLIYSLHFLENTFYHEQALKVSFNLNNYTAHEAS